MRATTSSCSQAKSTSSHKKHNR